MRAPTSSSSTASASGRCDGKGLAFLIQQALDADIPVVIAVASERFANWIKFAGGMTVKLSCDRAALDQWWRNVSTRASETTGRAGRTVCEVYK